MPCSNCEIRITDIQKRIADYWVLANDCKSTLLDKAYAAGLFGKSDEQDWYDKVNDYHYLLQYLLIIHEERIADINSSDCGVDQGKDYYIDKYNIECVIKHFMCMGCNITNLLAIFDLFDLNPTSSGEQDGIGYMAIWPTSDACSSIEFQVA